MGLVKELFENTYLATNIVYLDASPREYSESAATSLQVRDIILVTEKDLWPEDLLVVGGQVIEDTEYFTSLAFSNIDDTVDYCFQIGINNKGEEMATLVKVSDRGLAGQCDYLFKRCNQAITDEGQLLEAEYLATYKDKVWYILNETDRRQKLDCESEDVLNRCSKIAF